MVKVPDEFDLGSEQDITLEKLYWLLQRMYVELAESLNRKPDVYFRDVDGQATDVKLSNGDINVNTSTLKVEMLTKHVDRENVTWTTIS